MYDVIVIGGGIGGLIAAARLIKGGKKVLIIEKIHHIGGTSHIFKRNGYIFPMGPLSFSHPNLVLKVLQEIGIEEQITFERSHFQLISPDKDIIYSKNWDAFREELKHEFPEDNVGIDEFFRIISILIDSIKKVHEWHPDYLIGNKRTIAQENLAQYKRELHLIEKYDKTSSKKLLDDLIINDSLKRLLGSQGTYKPIMSILHLAFMWNVMSIEGIWFPSCGIHGINNMLKWFIINNGGKILLNTPVKEILIKNGKAIGVKDIREKLYKSDWLIANADYKKLILELMPKGVLPNNYINIIKDTDYTSSELCVYLGINPNKVDLKNLKAQHVFYRNSIKQNSNSKQDDFFNKEIEICAWSDKSKNFAPENKKSLILRVNMPYDFFNQWRIGEKKRKEGYKTFKHALAQKLIKTVEIIFPGLEKAIETMEVATPLTYRDWGQRTKGSIAGWTRNIKNIHIDSKLLVQTPIRNLLTVGIYSVLEPFLGGFPVSVFTGDLAADHVLDYDKKKLRRG